MTDKPSVDVQRLDPPRFQKFTMKRDLTPGEMTSLEKIAALRALCGKYASALRNIRAEATPGTTTHHLAEEALKP